jgi:hypothetical protein
LETPRFIPQYSRDLVHWQNAVVPVQQIASGEYEAAIRLDTLGTCFFRVISDR